MKIPKLQVILPLVNMMMTYGLFWLGGFDFDHRGIDTMLILMSILLIGFIGFAIAKEMKIK
jgi:uncharacterized membrane protein